MKLEFDNNVYTLEHNNEADKVSKRINGWRRLTVD